MSQPRDYRRASKAASDVVWTTLQPKDSMQPILAPYVRTFVDSLTGLPVLPSSVWLIGSQASGRAQAGSDTDLLVFGSSGFLAAVRAALPQPSGIDCLVVVNGNDFEEPWQDKRGALARWNWVLKSATEAQYEGTKFIADEPDGTLGQFETRQERAIRIWPS